MRQLYFDYAASTPVRDEVWEAMVPFFRRHYGNPSSLHSFGQEARSAVEKARQQVASALNCQSEEIFFTSGTSESDNWAIFGAARACQNRGKHLITSTIEHEAVLEAFRQLEKEGFQVTYLHPDKYGTIDPKKLMDAINSQTTLVSIMYANNEVGTIQSLPTIASMVGAIRRRRGREGTPLYLHTDAASGKYLPWTVDKLGVDLMSLGPHKYYGPKGVGILYVRKGVPINQFIYGGSQEKNQRAGTENVPAIVGAGLATKLMAKEKSRESKKLEKLQKKLTSLLVKEIKDIRLTGHPSQRVPDIVSLVIKGVEGEALVLHLNKMGMAVSSGSACTSTDLAPSHVLKAMGLKPELIHGSLRVSLGKETKTEDLTKLVTALSKTVKKLRDLAPKVEV